MDRRANNSKLWPQYLIRAPIPRAAQIARGYKLVKAECFKLYPQGLNGQISVLARYELPLGRNSWLVREPNSTGMLVFG